MQRPDFRSYVRQTQPLCSMLEDNLIPYHLAFSRKISEGSISNVWHEFLETEDHEAAAKVPKHPSFISSERVSSSFIDNDEKGYVCIGELGRIEKIVKAYFVNEDRILRRLWEAGGHEHVIGYYGAFPLKRRNYALMTEFVDGISLTDMINLYPNFFGRQDGAYYDHERSIVRVKPKTALEYLEKAGKALGYIHSLDIIHRDINPNNIMIGKDGSLKIIDFEISCFLHGENEVIDSFEDESGKMFVRIYGTEGYQAEEVLSDGIYSKSTDVYSLIVTAANILLGSCFQTEGFEENIDRVDNLEWVIEDYERFPESIRAIIDPCFYEDERYHTAEEFIERVRYARKYFF